jgi:hypothetical protein
MRTLRVCLAVAALGAIAGCGSGDGGAVMLTYSQAMGVSPTIAAFNSNSGTANTDSNGVITFTATSGQVTLTMTVQGPLTAGQQVDLLTEHNEVSIDIPGAGWSSNGGMLAVDGINPYRVRFMGVPMLAGSGTAKGSFVFDGTGTFK